MEEAREESHGTCRVKGREAGWSRQGWARLGCSRSQLGQRLFIWFLINQRKCLDQMGPLLLDCLPRAGAPAWARGLYSGLVQARLMSLTEGEPDLGWVEPFPHITNECPWVVPRPAQDAAAPTLSAEDRVSGGPLGVAVRSVK